MGRTVLYANSYHSLYVIAMEAVSNLQNGVLAIETKRNNGMDSDTTMPPANSSFFYWETTERIGQYLAEVAQKGVVGTDVAQVLLIFTLLLDRFGQDTTLESLRRRAESFIPEPGIPVFSDQLLTTPYLRVSVIGLHPLRPIPLHDHPDQWSAQWVLKGRLRVRRFDIHDKQLSTDSLAMLTLLDANELGPGDNSMITPSSGNIHGLTAIGRSVVVLSVQTRPQIDRPQCWFIPVNPLQDPVPEMLCNRITKPVPCRIDNNSKEV